MLAALAPCDCFVAVAPAGAYAPVSTRNRAGSLLQMNFFKDGLRSLIQEMDNFADDAMGRRLGNGAKFYGKRRSSFYGEEDDLRKADPQVENAEEDYSGPGG